MCYVVEGGYNSFAMNNLIVVVLGGQDDVLGFVHLFNAYQYEPWGSLSLRFMHGA